MECTNEKNNWIAAEIQLSYKTQVKPSMRPKVTSSEESYQVFKNFWDMDTIEFTEQFNVMVLDRANRVLGIFTAGSGGIAGVVADPKVIFAGAISKAASCIVVAHNHPSGNLRPSKEDFDLTRKLKEGGMILDLPVLDHLIIASDNYFSFADEGLI